MDYGWEIHGLLDASQGVSRQFLNLETLLNPHHRS